MARRNYYYTTTQTTNHTNTNRTNTTRTNTTRSNTTTTTCAIGSTISYYSNNPFTTNIMCRVCIRIRIYCIRIRIRRIQGEDTIL